MSYEQKMCNPETGRMFDRLAQYIREDITVPNRLLPAMFHDNKSGERTLQRLEELCDKRDGLTEHVGDFVDLDGELDYSMNEVDEPALHRNMIALVGGMVNGGMLEADDLLED